MKYVILRMATLPADILGWLIVLVLHVLWGARLKIQDGILITMLRANSWPIRSWYKNWGGTTFGHAIMLNPNVQDVDRLLFHEKVHVEQYEVTSLLNLLFAGWLVCMGHYIAAGLLVAFASLFMVLSALIVAWLRNEPPYRGSVLEEAAYDATDLHDPE